MPEEPVKPDGVSPDEATPVGERAAARPPDTAPTEMTLAPEGDRGGDPDLIERVAEAVGGLWQDGERDDRGRAEPAGRGVPSD